jgi:hypothetical protein
MARPIMGHGVSGCFGTSLAPSALTRGLGIVSNPHAAHVNPSETTTQDMADRGLDGDGLSCPGSSVVAEERIN